MENSLSVNAPPRPRLMVATPMYGGQCYAPYVMGMLQMAPIFQNAGISFRFMYLSNESLITRARDALTYEFLRTDCTHLMFIDSDIGFDPNHIVQMVAADKDIVCGIYPKKEINWVQVAAAVKAGVPPQELHNYTGSFVLNPKSSDNGVTTMRMNELLEIDNGGTGFMLIKRHVFETLAPTTPTYTRDMYNVTAGVPRQRETIHKFFDTSIDPEADNRLLSEDYHFCRSARKAGFKVYAAPWVALAHTGSYVFSGRPVPAAVGAVSPPTPADAPEAPRA